MGIEAMFKDYKTGGDNLESAKANEIRLNNWWSCICSDKPI